MTSLHLSNTHFGTILLMHSEICQVGTGQLVAAMAVKDVLMHSGICHVCIGQIVAAIASKDCKYHCEKGDIDALAS